MRGSLACGVCSSASSSQGREPVWASVTHVGQRGPDSGPGSTADQLRGLEQISPTPEPQFPPSEVGLVGAKAPDELSWLVPAHQGQLCGLFPIPRWFMLVEAEMGCCRHVHAMEIGRHYTSDLFSLPRTIVKPFPAHHCLKPTADPSIFDHGPYPGQSRTE